MSMCWSLGYAIYMNRNLVVYVWLFYSFQFILTWSLNGRQASSLLYGLVGLFYPPLFLEDLVDFLGSKVHDIFFKVFIITLAHDDGVWNNNILNGWWCENNRN